MSSPSQPSLFGKSWLRAHKGYLVALKVAVTAAAVALLLSQVRPLSQGAARAGRAASHLFGGGPGLGPMPAWVR